jgi:hypothetical protein
MAGGAEAKPTSPSDRRAFRRRRTDKDSRNPSYFFGTVSGLGGFAAGRGAAIFI